ncbi:MAG: ChbG/HpnK family deacetylase [Planctomycetes bacterium]|nr:ChbG/HpnK family deacetylase [Planctomycetota bacterium]
MRTLIVTADDLGASAAANEAIARAARAGIVTQASVLGNGAALADAAARFLGAAPAGLHLNLTEGHALTGVLPGATDGAGRLRGPRPLLLACLRRAVDLAALEREWDAQIGRVRAAGFRPAHLDGHHHVHVFPGMLDVALRLARRHGIGALRVPHEGALFRHGGARLKRALLCALCRGARAAARRAALRVPDHFFGLSLFRRGHDHHSRLLALLARLPQGSTELMVHPGDGLLGGVETASLTHPETRAALSRLDIRLATSASLPALD